MAQIAMLRQGGFGGVRFADKVRSREPARDRSPTGAFRRSGGVRRLIPGNDAQRAERAAGAPAKLRDMP